MPDDALTSPWDFLSLVAGWSLYGLPALLTAIALAWTLRRAQGPSSALIRTLALIHLGLGLRSGVGLAQELLTLRVQGIPQSFPVTGIMIPTIVLVANLAIGHGLWRLQSWTRWAAITWDALTAVFSAMVAVWQWKHHAVIRPDQWPDYLVANALPWFLLVVMLLPATRSLFATRRISPGARPADSSGWLHKLLLPAVLCLVVVLSTLFIDALDWFVRSIQGDGAVPVDEVGSEDKAWHGIEFLGGSAERVAEVLREAADRHYFQEDMSKDI